MRVPLIYARFNNFRLQQVNSRFKVTNSLGRKTEFIIVAFFIIDKYLEMFGHLKDH